MQRQRMIFDHRICIDSGNQRRKVRQQDMVVQVEYRDDWTGEATRWLSACGLGRRRVMNGWLAKHDMDNLGVHAQSPHGL